MKVFSSIVSSFRYPLFVTHENRLRSTDFSVLQACLLVPLPERGVLVDLGQVVVGALLLTLLRLRLLLVLGAGDDAAADAAAGRRAALALAAEVEGDEVPHEPGLQQADGDQGVQPGKDRK